MTRILTDGLPVGSRMRSKYGAQAAKDDDALITKMRRWITEGSEFCSPIHERSSSNMDYVAGGIQWTIEDMQAQAAKGRSSFVLNKILHVVNAIANREMTQRFVPKVYGRSREDGQQVEAFDEFLRWQRDTAETEHEDSAAFRATVVSGYGCVHKYWDPLELEGDGCIMDEEIPIWNMIWDSRARKQNLIDRRWHMCGKYVSRLEAEEEYGQSNKRSKEFFNKLATWEESGEDMRSAVNSAGASGRGAWSVVSSGTWYNATDDEVFLTEVEWQEVKPVYKVAVPIRMADAEGLLMDPAYSIELPAPPPDPAAPQDPTMPPPGPTVFTGADFMAMDPEQQRGMIESLLTDTKATVFDSKSDVDAIADRYFEVTSQEFEDWISLRRYSTKYAVVSDDVVLERGERPMGFTYEFMTGFPNPRIEETTFFGFVDVAKGPQDWRNTFMNLVLTRLAYSPKQMILVEQTAVDDVDTFFDQLSNPRGGATVPDGFVSGNRFTMIPQAPMPPLERELIQLSDQGITELAGLSGIELGGGGDLRRVSGNVVQSVRESSNTILAVLFDSLRRYRRRSGRLTLAFMPVFYEPSEVMRIVGEEKGQFLGEMEDWSEIQRYDVKMDEAPASVTEKMEFFDFMTRTGTLEKWVDTDRIPFDMVVDWNPMFSGADKIRIREHAAKKDQINQLTQQVQQLTQQLQEAGGGQAAPAPEAAPAPAQ